MWRLELDALQYVRVIQFAGTGLVRNGNTLLVLRQGELKLHVSQQGEAKDSIGTVISYRKGNDEVIAFFNGDEIDDLGAESAFISAFLTPAECPRPPEQ